MMRRKFITRSEARSLHRGVCVCVWPFFVGTSCTSADTFDSDASQRSSVQVSWTVIIGVEMRRLQEARVKTCVLYVRAHRPSFPIVMVFIIKRQTMCISWAHRPISSWHVSFWCPFLIASLAIYMYRPNIGVRLKKSDHIRATYLSI